MQDLQIQRLKINYKTLDHFRRFKEFGNQELSMLEDLQNNIIENDSDSPFYGIHFGDNLIARMSLYTVNKKYDDFFEPQQTYHELWKLEVLPDFRGKGYGRALVNYAKGFQLPIRTNPRINSHGFWEKVGFQKATYDIERDFGDNPLVWLPNGVQQREV